MLFEVPICGFDMCMLVDTRPTLDFLLMFGCLVDPLRIPLKYHHGETLPQIYCMLTQKDFQKMQA